MEWKGVMACDDVYFQHCQLSGFIFLGGQSIDIWGGCILRWSNKGVGGRQEREGEEARKGQEVCKRRGQTSEDPLRRQTEGSNSHLLLHNMSKQSPSWALFIGQFLKEHQTLSFDLIKQRNLRPPEQSDSFSLAKFSYITFLEWEDCKLIWVTFVPAFPGFSRSLWPAASSLCPLQLNWRFDTVCKIDSTIQSTFLKLPPILHFGITLQFEAES